MQKEKMDGFELADEQVAIEVFVFALLQILIPH